MDSHFFLETLGGTEQQSEVLNSMFLLLFMQNYADLTDKKWKIMSDPATPLQGQKALIYLLEN